MCSCLKRIAMKLHNLACNIWIMKDWALKHTCKHSFVEFHGYEHHWCHLKWNWSQKLTCMSDFWRYGTYMKFECMGFDHTKKKEGYLRIRWWFWTIWCHTLIFSCNMMCLHVFELKSWVWNLWTSKLNSKNSFGKPRIWHVRSSGQ